MKEDKKNKKNISSLFMISKNQDKDSKSSDSGVDDIFQIGDPNSLPEIRSRSSGNWTQPGISGDTYRKDHPREKNFSGIGPKGYHRSDEKIYEDVCEALLKDSQIDAQNIVVKVEDAVVHLMGRVSSLEMKKRATQIVSDLSGVREVETQLSIIKGIISNDDERSSFFLDDSGFH